MTYIINKPLPQPQQYCRNRNCGKPLHKENSTGDGFCIGFCREAYERKREREGEPPKGGDPKKVETES